MTRDTILAPSFPMLLERLVGNVVLHHRDDPLAPELVLVSGAPLARFVESALASGSPSPLLNVQVIPLRWAAERLAGRIVDVPQAPPALFMEGSVRHVLMRAASDLARLHGADRMVLATFNELLDAGLHDLEPLAELVSILPTGRDRRTLELYLAWRELLDSKRLSPSQLLVNRISLDVDARWVHVYGFLRLEGVVADLVDRIAGASPDSHLTVYCPCHPEAVRGLRCGYDYVVGHVEEHYMLRVSERLAEPSYESGLFAEIDGLLTRPAHDGGDDTPLRHVSFAAAAGEAGEVEAAVRGIATLLNESRFSSRPEDIALLAPDISAYEPSLLPALADMDIPARWLCSLSASHHPAVRWMAAMLSVTELGSAASTIRELLTSPFIRYPDPWPVETSVEVATHMAPMGEALLGSGEWTEQWGVPAGEGWGGLVRAFVEERAGLCTSETAAEFLSRVTAFLSRWVQPALVREGGTLEGWSRILGTFRDLDQLGFLGEPAGEYLLSLCRDSLDAVTLPAPHPRGIVVGSMGTALGMSFDHVFVLGANRGSLPRPVREDPFLSESIRRRIVEEMGYPVALRSDLPARDKLVFILTLLSARRHAWVIHQHADANGESKSPSLLISLIFHSKAAHIVQHHTERTARLTRLVEEGTADLTCREIARMAAMAGDLPMIDRLQDGVGPSYAPCLRRAMEAAHARESAPDATAFDMRTAPPTRLNAMLRSVAGWEDLEICPYRFFMSRILGISAEDSPGPLWEPAPPDRGNLVHAALERLLRQGLPEPDDVPRRVETAWREACESFAQRYGRTALPGVLSLEMARARAWVRHILESELDVLRRRRLEGGGGFTISAERQFDVLFRGSDVEIPLSVRFDRLESRRQGERLIDLLITDYKVRAKDRGADRDMGSLQAFLYAEAAERTYGIRPDFEYAEITQDAESRTLRIPGSDTAIAAQYRDKAEYLLQCAHRGVWFMRIDQVVCGFCHHRRLCRRYDAALAAKALSVGAAHEQTLERMDRDLKQRLRPMVSPRYPTRSGP